MRRLFAALTLLIGGCCSSLPKTAATKTAALLAARSGEVRVERYDWRDERRQRDVPATIYVPADSSVRHPVVVFSHGIGENRDSYEYLGRALAGAGFLAVHVTHAGTDRAVLEKGYWNLYKETKKKANWRNRPLDASFALDQVASRPDADMDHVAVVGHSAGAFTAFAIAGLKLESGESLGDPRVKVIVPLSMPRLDGVVAPGGYDAVTIPVLNMTGTCDSSIIYRTRPHHRRIPFESTHATRQYLVTVEDLNHDSFSNRSDPFHPLITQLTIGFLRGFMLGDSDARAWFNEAGRGSVAGKTLVLEKK